MNDSISVDIEACGQVVLSIGACKFNEETGVIGETFYSVLGVNEQIKRGLQMDAGSFNWWLKQSDVARQALSGEQEPVKDALKRLEQFAQPHGSRVWAYPTSYDLPIIANLCGVYGVRVPWKWTETMCARTLWKLAMQHQPGIERIESENPLPHHALEDAKEQARWITAYLKAVLT